MINQYHECRSTVVIPVGMKKLAEANGRSLAQEAKQAMLEYLDRHEPKKNKKSNGK